MKNIIFLAWYTGDIGKAIFDKLSNQKDFDIIPISWRWEEDRIQTTIFENFNPLWKNILINAIWCWVYWMFEELDLNDYQESFGCNFYIPAKIIRHFVQYNKEVSKQSGNKLNTFIFNINSQSGIKPFAQGSAYCSMKSALSMLLKVIKLENSKYWLKTFEIYPWVIQTRITEKMPYIPKSGVILLDYFVADFERFLFDNIS